MYRLVGSFIVELLPSPKFQFQADTVLFGAVLRSVKILKPVKPPNVFSPNGDGINDKWMISNLSDYPGAFVEIFNRYGQRIFYSAGYNDPWDGTLSGKPLPVATYYYVITLKNSFEPLTGSVTIIR